jgi:hypothetical protein
MTRLFPLQEVSLDDYLSGGDMLRAALDDLVWASGGEATFGVIVGGSIILSMWIAGDGDLSMPSVITVLFGGLMFPLLPPAYLTIARVVTFIGLTAGVLAAGEKYYLEGNQ